MKGNMELRWLPHDAHHPINDLGRAFAPIIPQAMCPMHLKIVVPNPAVMGRLEVVPRRRLSKGIISHTPLHVEHGLAVVLPCLTFVDLVLGNIEVGIEFKRFLRSKDAATVTHQSMWTSMMLDRGKEHNEVRRDVLFP